MLGFRNLVYSTGFEAQATRLAACALVHCNEEVLMEEGEACTTPDGRSGWLVANRDGTLSCVAANELIAAYKGQQELTAAYKAKTGLPADVADDRS